MRALLDTCALIWVLESSPRIGQRTRNLIEDDDAEILVSSASIVEIAIKSRQGRLLVSGSLPDVLAELEIGVLAISAEHAWRVRTLPDTHPDPFDRLIAAQGLVEGVPVVTADAGIRRLGAAVLSPFD